MNILVTGGLGYIGSHLVIELLKFNYNVYVIDNLSNSKKKVKKKIEKITNKKFLFFKFNLLNKNKINFFFQRNKIDVVIHMAGFKSVLESEKNPILYYENNIVSSVNLFRAMELNKVKKIIFSSSATVYGVQKKFPISENSFTGPTNSYGVSKRIIEEMIIDLAKKNVFDYIILRYFNPVGCHESGILGEDPNEKAQNLFPYIMAVLQGKYKHLKIYGKNYQTIDGTGARDYIHISDLCSAHLSSLKNLIKKKILNEIFNVGTGKPYSVLQVVKEFEKVIGKNLSYKFCPRRPGDLDKVYTETKKIKKKLNWKASHNLRDMCSSCYLYVRNLL